MNDTPRANRLHIGLFGKRNAGKSSLINALTHQDTALVSDIPGTTTDPVQKAMELLPLGRTGRTPHPPDTACAGEDRHRPDGLYRRTPGRRVTLATLVKGKECTCYLDTEQM